jgi:predicted ATPase
MTKRIPMVALTSGPGGGKSTLLWHLREHPVLGGRIVVMEEAMHLMRFVRLSPVTPAFQCALVAIQAGTEDFLRQDRQGTDTCAVVSHRGTLDPCAFWQSFGNLRESFFEMTGTTLEDHYRRYDLVIHMESAAVRVPEEYVRYPHAHRPEDVQQAAQLDHLLGELWCGHPNYVKIEGTKGVQEKLVKAVEVVRQELGMTFGHHASKL